MQVTGVQQPLNAASVTDSLREYNIHTEHRTLVTRCTFDVSPHSKWWFCTGELCRGATLVMECTAIAVDQDPSGQVDLSILECLNIYSVYISAASELIFCLALLKVFRRSVTAEHHTECKLFLRRPQQQQQQQ